MTDRRHFATLVTDSLDGVEITWEVPYSWSKPVPATRIDPPEGGLELDGDVRPVKTIRQLDNGMIITLDRIPKGSRLDIAIIAGYDPPSEEMCWEAASEHNEARLEDTRY